MTDVNLMTAMAFVTDEDIAREMDHENSMLERGTARERSRQDREKARGNASATPGARSLLKKLALPLADAIKEEVDRLADGNVRKKPPELKTLQLLPPRDYAVVALRAVLDQLGAGHLKDGTVTAQKLGFAIGQEVCREAQVRAFYENSKPLFEAVVRKVRERTSSPAQRVKELVGAYQRTCEDAMEDLTTTEKVRLGVFIVTVMEGLGLLVADTMQSTKTHTVKTYDLSDEAWDVIATVDGAVSELKPLLLPTVIPPMHWADQNTGGYWLPTKQNNLVKARNRSNGVRGMTGDDAPRMFSPLNYLQSVPYRINRKVLAVVERMRESGISCDSLPSFDLETPPPRPSDIDTNEEARKGWRTATRGVHTRNNARKGKLLATSRTISVAADMRDEPTIYFPKMIDFRGRVYDLPLFLKPQGDDLSKGLLQFANGKPLGDMGAYWLAIHLANTWGEDKVSFDDRQAWVQANEDRILAIARDPFAERMWMDADSPFQFLAACFEWLGYSETGEAHVSHISIGLDGSCNGLQHLSAILRDPVGGAAVNLLPSPKPQDIYTEVMVKVKEELTRRAEAGEPTAQRWLPLVTRKTVKRPVMTLPYGATQQGFADQIMEDTLRPIEKSGQSPFGSEGYDACRYLGSIVWQATGETVVAARQVMDWLQEVAKVVASTGAPLSWESPSGFRVVQSYLKPSTKNVELRAVGQRVAILVADGHTSKMDKQKMARSISPNFVHAMDAAHMLRTVELLLDTVGPSVHLAMVHDSYGCHACDADTLSRALRQAFVQMYHERDWLESFRDEVAAQVGEELASTLPPLPGKGSLHLSEVVNSLYFFA